MLNTTPTTLRSAKLPPDVMPASDRYPHYRLVPLAGSDGRYCLFFHITPKHWLVLEANATRRRMAELLGRMREKRALSTISAAYAGLVFFAVFICTKSAANWSWITLLLSVAATAPKTAISP